MPEPTEPSPEQRILTFEKFSERDESNYPRFGNFYAYFDNDPDGIYRDKPHFVRFERENPELSASLQEKIRNRRVQTGNTSGSLRPFDQDLYEAYKIMKSYGISDRALFS